jgi:hypothetical protein
VLANGGFITTHGSKAIPEPVLEETMNEFRATIRPFVGDVVTIRTDSIRQTTTAKRWQRYVNGPAPVQVQEETDIPTISVAARFRYSEVRSAEIEYSAGGGKLFRNV